MTAELYPLQRILFPTLETLANEKLYFRVKPNAAWRLGNEGGVSNIAGYTHGPQTLEFNTFFGACSLSTWCGPAGLDEIVLELECQGTGLLRVWNDDGNEQPHLLLEERIAENRDEPLRVRLAGLRGKRGILYPEFEGDGRGFILRGARYLTPQAPKSRVRLAIVMPSYRRESYVLRNMEMFRERLRAAGLRDAIEMIVVDNGRTLDIPASEGVRIIPNPNFGGAGGFARGLMEVLEGNQGFTHVLFCDDDVQIEPESIHRLYNLLGYVDEKATIGGGMLNMDEKQRLHELGAFFKNMTWRSDKNYLDMTEANNVVVFDAPGVCNYFGWWFYATSVAVFRDNGYPLPFFVRGDDQEFGLRLFKNKYPMISLLGCAVWHEEFHKKDPPLMWYYMMRNNIATSLMYETGFVRSTLFECCRRILMMMLTYRYEHAEYMIDGIADALEGPAFFKTINPEKLHGEKAGGQALKPVPVARKDFVSKKFNIDLEKSCLKSLWILVTLNGHLLPSFLMRRAEGPASNGWAIEKLHSRRFQAIFRCPVVLYYEPTVGEGIFCRIDRKRFFAVGIKSASVLIRLVLGHKRLRREWRVAHTELISSAFWKHHLGLDA